MSEKKTTEEFIAEARKIHGDKYDYLKVAYFNNKTPVIITCPKHGDFKMTPKNHSKGQGCHKCYTEWWSQHLRLTTEEFIEKARKVHGAKYDYSGVNYIDTETPITIICSTHGPFHQKPHYHLAGCGCPYCIQSNLEEQIATLLKETQIEYEEQKLFSWLKNKKAMKLDFYLPQYKLAIECQGCQHFYPVSLFGGFKAYQQTVKRDRLKYELCQEHGIPILYFSLPQDAPSDYLSDIYTNKARLLEEIYRYGTKQRDTGFIQGCTNTVRGTNTLGTVN